MASSAKRWVRWWRTKVKAHVLGLWGSPSARGNRACKRRKASSVTRHGRHRTSPALHVTRKTRSRRLAVAPLHHGAPRCDRCYHPETNAWKLVRTGINGCSAMAHPLTHLTHGIPTRRPFHPAKRRLSQIAESDRHELCQPLVTMLLAPVAHPSLRPGPFAVDRLRWRTRHRCWMWYSDGAKNYYARAFVRGGLQEGRSLAHGIGGTRRARSKGNHRLSRTRRSSQALLLRLLHCSKEAPKNGSQPKDRQGSAHFGAPCDGVQAISGLEGTHQLPTLKKCAARVPAPQTRTGQRPKPGLGPPPWVRLHFHLSNRRAVGAVAIPPVGRILRRQPPDVRLHQSGLDRR